ncbi:MAG: DUF748 domain-containing protein [Nitrospirae bacterium]|nr:DUF748 domain-containing protein [Nitrospirota bacterium]
MRVFKILRILVLIAMSLVALYAGIGFLGVPWAVKKYGVPEVSKVLGRPVILRDIAFDPFAFNLKLEGFEIQEVDGSPMVGFEQLFVNFEATSVLEEVYRFEIIRLSLPYGLVKIFEDGRLNLAELGKQRTESDPLPPEIAESENDPSDDKPLVVEIGLLSIEQGVVEFRDESKSTTFVADIVPLQITLRNFSTRPGNQNSYFVAAELGEGERVQWQGNVSLEPLRSQGQIEVSGLRSETLWQYVQDLFKFEISQGLLDLQVSYDVDMATEPMGLVLNNGTITLRNFALREKGQSEELIVIPSFSIRGIEADVGARRVSVDSIQSRGTEVRGWINQDGTVNFQALFASTEAKVADVESNVPPASNSEELPWSATIKKISLEEYAVRFEDRQPHTPVPLHIEGFGLQVQNVTTDLTQPIILELGLTFNQSGKLAISGQVTLEPPAGDLKLDLSGFTFTALQPYLEPLVRFQLKRGALAIQGHTTFKAEVGQDPAVRFSGDVTLDDFALAEADASEEFLKWEQLAFQGLAVETQPTRVDLREIVVTLPYAKVVQGAEGVLNVSRLFSPPGSPSNSSEDEGVEKDAKSSTDATEDATPSPLITIGTIRIQNAAVDFTDQAIDPHVVTGLQNFSGTIQGLSSQELSKADVSLEGRVDDVATLKIHGQVNPLQKDVYTDLTLAFQNMDLTTVSPYAWKFMGYPITKGKLSLDLDYSLSEHILIGENKVQIDQLTLGEATDSPDAPSLPVPLALALLKDRDGRIDIDLPVRGDLNNPEFSYGQLVLQTLMNLITKAATSPFSMIGGMLGGRGDDLAKVNYAAGQSALSEPEIAKLSTLASALAQRPGLRLEITGGAEPTKDGLSLATTKLEAQLKERRQQELSPPGQPQTTPSVVEDLSSNDRDRLLAELFVQRFGNTLAKGRASIGEGESGSTDSQVGTEPGGPQQAKPKLPSVDEMQQRLLETIETTEAELRLLAQERARSIRDHLVNQENIPEERIFLVEANLASESDGDGILTRLSLTAQ